MDLHRHVPGPPLDGFVDHFWYVAARDLRHPRQVLFPDGGVTVHFNLGDAPGLVRNDTGEITRYATTWISGERVEPYTLDVPGRVRLLGIRFRPGAVFPFLGFPAREVAGHVVELDHVLGGLADEAWERVAEADDPLAAFAVLEEVLRRRMGGGPDTPPASVCAALAAMQRAGPGLSVIDLAAELGVSHRTLLRLFERWVGVTPKTIQRVFRFQRVIALEDVGEALDWSRVAYRCGYYDQAHLIRDFREFTRTTPTAYRAARLEYPNYVPDGA